MNILHAQWKDFHLIGDGEIIPVRIKEDNSSGNNYSVKQISLPAQPIKSTTQIWVVTRHQYGIFVLVSQTSFRDETSDGVEKCRLILFLRVLFSLGIAEQAKYARVHPLENEGLLTDSHLFLNGVTNRACSRWSDSGLLRQSASGKK